MLLVVMLFGLLAGSLQAAVLRDTNCAMAYRDSDLSQDYRHNIAHSLHAQLAAGLPFFNPRCGSIDVMAYYMGQDRPFAKISVNQHDNLPTDFTTIQMRTLDAFMYFPQRIFTKHGYIFTLVHTFHTFDMLESIRQEYNSSIASRPPSHELCACLLNDGGIRDDLAFFNSPDEGNSKRKLEKPGAWDEWRKYPMQFLTKPALRDAAMYLHCATI